MATKAAGAMVTYKVVAVPQKMPDAEDFLNDMASDGWKLSFYLPSGLGVFEKAGAVP